MAEKHRRKHVTGVAAVRVELVGVMQRGHQDLQLLVVIPDSAGVRRDIA